ncbi:MAG: Kdo hydroxylase family protein [Acidobacteriota bacterium]
MEIVSIYDTGSEVSPYHYEKLEEGNVLFIDRIPVEFSEDDYNFLMSQRGTSMTARKNIAYRPVQDVLTGAARSSDQEKLYRVMRSFSQQAVQLLSRLLARYAAGWKLDYASLRPFEEEGRDLSLHARNDLLHFDAFPTRPTHGDRIMRFFINLNPTRPRVWLTSESFGALADRFAEQAGLLAMGRRAASPARRQLARIGRFANLPQFRRSPYDVVMHQFHNFLKENEDFQKNCPKQRVEFPPRSSWIVFTDSVSHAVLSGQMAIEQTFIIPCRLMVHPEQAPARILERMAGVSLTS